MNADQIRQEVGERLASSGIKMIADRSAACTVLRGWVQDKQNPADYWHTVVVAVCSWATIGARADVAQVTILPCDNAIEPVRDSVSKKEFVIQRFKFLIAFTGKRWTGIKVSGISPTNAELADPRNWNDARPQERQQQVMDNFEKAQSSRTDMQI